MPLMKINRALKVRLYPTQEQSIFFNKTIGCCRFIYNAMLAERKEVYERLKDDKRTLYEYKYKTEKQYKEEFEWLKEVDAKALVHSNRDLQAAYSNFYKSLSGKSNLKNVGLPKFKKKRNGGSYRTHQYVHVYFQNNTITVPKARGVKFRCKNIKPWYFSAEVKSITVSKKPSGKYYASILFEGEQDFIGTHEVKKDSKVIGLDMSMDKFYVDQYGNSPEYKRNYRQSEKKLARAQKALSRKQNGSANKNKARIRVAKINEKIANRRNDFIHKESINLIRENDVIVVESLSLAGMSRALNLGKSVYDLGYSEFIRQLDYKAMWNDKTVIHADKWFASSKICYSCGFKNKDLMLHERSWTCPNCGKKVNRDQNAALNLVNLGLKEIGAGSSEFKPVEKV